jgi:hypothetical protein
LVVVGGSCRDTIVGMAVLQRTWRALLDAIGVTAATDDVRTVAGRRLELLRQRPYAALAAMPALAVDSETVGGHRVGVAVWIDALPDSRVQVVVQAYRRRVLGIGTLSAQGFIVSADGSHAEVPAEMIAEFA